MALKEVLAPVLGEAIDVRGHWSCWGEAGVSMHYDIFEGDNLRITIKVVHFTAPELAEETLRDQLTMTQASPAAMFSKPPPECQLGDRALMFGRSPCWVRGSLFVDVIRDCLAPNGSPDLMRSVSRTLDAYLADNEFIAGTRPNSSAPIAKIPDQTVSLGGVFSIAQPSEHGEFLVHGAVTDLGPDGNKRGHARFLGHELGEGTVTWIAVDPTTLRVTGTPSGNVTVKEPGT